MKVFLYVQHLVGIGHLRRILLLAKAMEETGMDAVIVSGGRPATLFRDAHLHQLPPAHCEPADFAALLDQHNRPVTDDWKQRRSSLLQEFFHREQPDVLLLESFPFGRRQFRFELIPLLESAVGRSDPPRIICSIRDVLQRRSNQREEESLELLNRWFDCVWVHGDPDWIRLDASFSRTSHIEPEVFYTGYVSDPRDHVTSRQDAGVVVSAGGSSAGEKLMRCAARARPLSRVADLPWRFLVGGEISQDLASGLAEDAGPGTVVEPVRTDFKSVLAGCRLSISQLGYNTAIDLIQAGVRAVAVPFEGPGETEQRTRAEMMMEKGLLEMMPEAELTPKTLAAAIDRALARTRPHPAVVDLDGAANAAHWLAARTTGGVR